jgi:hypothetical protein
MTNKERYRKFCATHAVVPVFSNPFWLDAVAENWDVALVSESEVRVKVKVKVKMKVTL